MQIDTEQVSIGIGVLTALATGVWGLILHFDKKIDLIDEKTSEAIDALEKNLQNKIDSIRKDTVSRSEYEREMNSIYAEIRGVRNDVKEIMSQVSTRIDVILQSMIAGR